MKGSKFVFLGVFFVFVSLLLVYSNVTITTQAENESSYKVFVPQKGSPAYAWRSRKLSNTSGYTGWGYWYLSRGGDKLIYNIYIPQGGTYRFNIRDFNDLRHPSQNRQISIYVDGKFFASTYPLTKRGWNVHQVGQIYLSQGTHTIILQKVSTTSAAAVIDSFTLIKI